VIKPRCNTIIDEFFFRSYPEHIRLEELNGKAPCSKCYYQNQCEYARECEIYKKWRKTYKR